MDLLCWERKIQFHKKLLIADNSILWSWKGFFVHWTKSAFPQHNHRMIQVGYQPYMMKWLPKAKLPKVCLLTSLGRLNLGAFLDIPLNTSILLLQKRLLNLTYLKVKHDFLNVRLFGTYSTLFENYPKCRIWILEFWHFPPFFVLLKLTYLVTLFDRKLQFFKNSPKWTIFGIFD